MKIEKLNEAYYLFDNPRVPENIFNMAENIAGIGSEVEKKNNGKNDGYSSYVGGRMLLALKIAKEIKSRLDLRFIKANYEELYDVLEDNNYHTECRALMALVNPNDLRELAVDELDFVMKTLLK